MTDQYAEEKRWVSDRERKRVPDHKSSVSEGSLLKGPPAHPNNTECQSMRG